jgi:hypothetical protein
LDADTVTLKEQLKEARAKLAEMNKQEIPADVQKAKRLEKAKENLRKRLNELNSQVARKEAKAKIDPIEYDLEYLDLKQQVAKQKAVLDEMVSPPESIGHKVRRVLVSSVTTPIGWLASLDNSYLGRQGIKMLAHRPKVWLEGAKASFKALGSEQAAWEIDTAIRHDPQFVLAQKSGLEYTAIDTHANLASAEETSMYLRRAEKIPVLGKAFRPFDRAYTTAANVMRHEAFYRMADVMGKDWTPEHYKTYASFLNKLTGRGDLGRMKVFQPELQGIFISPRKIAADVQVLLTPFDGPKEVRVEAAKTLVRYTAALGTLAYVVNASGKAKIGTNPEEADFMKLRIGDTRFDITGGQAQVVRTVWRMGQAAVRYSRFGEAKYKEDSPTDYLMKTLGNKQSPGISAGKALYTGKDFKGDPITPAQVALDLVTPWNIGDIVDSWREEGPGMAVIAGISGFFGMSAQSYKDEVRPADILFADDNVNRELTRLEEGKAEGEDSVVSTKYGRNFTLYDDKGDSHPVRLSDSQFEEYQKEAVKAEAEALKKLFESDEYKKPYIPEGGNPDEERRWMVRNERSWIRASVRDKFSKKWLRENRGKTKLKVK